MNYLIIGRNYVGDAIMSQPLLATLKKQNPTCKITVIAGGAGFLTYQSMQEVDEVIKFEWRKKSLQLQECYRFAQKLTQKYDVSITLNNSIKSALIPFFLKVPKRLGYLGEMRYGLLTHYLKNIPKKSIKELPIIDYYYRILELEKNENNKNNQLIQNQKTKLIPQLSGDFIEQFFITNNINVAEIELQKKNFKPLVNWEPVNLKQLIEQPFLVIAPGAATSDAKKYPISLFIELITRFHQKYPLIPIVLLGSKDDELIGEQITSSLNQSKIEVRLINLINQIPLLTAFYLIGKSRGVIANDSGLLHVAGALNKACLGIYGPTGVTFASPRNDDFIAVENKNLSCRPCYKGTCLFAENSSEYLQCMISLTPENILKKIELWFL